MPRLSFAYCSMLNKQLIEPGLVLECLNLARYPGYFWNSYCYRDFLLSNRLSARNPGYYWEAYGYRDFLVSMRYSGEGCPILKNLAPQ